MHRLLLVEPSATLRHILVKSLSEGGCDIHVLDSFARAVQTLRQPDPAAPAFHALVVGWPVHSDPDADELFSLLDGPDCCAQAVLILVQENQSAAQGWVAPRPRTALLPWQDYAEAATSLNKLLSPVRPEAPSAVTGEKPVRVLFVDDSPTIRAKFRRLLTHNGYLTEIASCAEEALEKAKKDDFDIAIVDYFMPDENGDVLCRRLRDNPKTTHIQSAIITGTYMDRVIQDSLEAGAVECMFKNEADELFLARIAAMSRAARDRRAVERERQRLAGILSSVGEGVYGVGEDGRVTFMNPASKQILGYDIDDASMVGQSPYDVIHYAGKDVANSSRELSPLGRAYTCGEPLRSWETVFWHRSGKAIPVECTVYPLQIESRCEGSVVAFRDISERKSLEEKLRWQATHDALTELFNRRYFEEQLEREVRRLKRSEESSAVLYLDLDRFKYINDTAGHAAGDQLLTEIGRHLRNRLREADMLARLGGDEFAIILRNVDVNNLQGVADDFLRLLANYNFSYGGRSYKVNASVGVAVIDKDTRSPGEVLVNADIACHLAKRHGRNQAHVYQGEQDEPAAMDLDLGWEMRLRDALAQDHFVLHFQPIVHMADLAGLELPLDGERLWETIGRRGLDAECYEVLVRLVGDEGEIISPRAFFPTAERFNLVQHIDLWVLRNAIPALARLNTGGRVVTFSINLSGQVLGDERLLPLIRGLMQEAGLDPSRLVFEITETSAIDNLDAARRVIGELKSLGCRFALDDFGSGFSSFSHLKHLPVDLIKIDGVFVQGMAADPIDRAMVASMNDIAHSLGRQTVAEYVENADILRLLKECGVDYVQGYYVSEPIPSAEVLKRLKDT